MNISTGNSENKFQLHFKKIKLSPPQIITLSFALMILTGALLLSLPIATNSGQSVGFLNALFTATSANCVTGLAVVNTLETWSFFGKAVILLLIQLGGLGLITILTIGMVLFKKQISLRNRMVIQASFNENNIGGMVKLIQRIVIVTLLVETVGAVCLTTAFYFAGMDFGQAVYNGIFHSISAFCNAGFDNIGTESLASYKTNVFINAIIGVLIILGGLGFTVLGDILTAQKKRKKKPLRVKLQHLKLHTKLVLSITAALLLIGTALFLVIEWNNPATLGPLHPFEKIMAAFFQSVTLRTCGFFTIDQGAFHDISQAISAVFMFIGGSPAGTAGGMKTVTLGIILAAMVSVLKGRSQIEAFGRTLPLDLLQKALSVTGTLMIVIFVSTLVLHFTEQGNGFQHNFLDLLFETTSAAGTVGLTTGITPFLSNMGKMVITFCMFLGRLSPVTVVVALNMRLHTANNGLSYPEERVIIG